MRKLLPAPSGLYLRTLLIFSNGKLASAPARRLPFAHLERPGIPGLSIQNAVRSTTVKLRGSAGKL